MALKVYSYKNCGTCRKALKFLEAQGVAHKVVPIREEPPTKTELRKMLRYLEGDLKKMFNTSGGDYREMNLKDKLPSMSDTEAIDLLCKNGNLVKRPFVLAANDGSVGFNEDAWREKYLA